MFLLGENLVKNRVECAKNCFRLKIRPVKDKIKTESPPNVHAHSKCKRVEHRDWRNSAQSVWWRRWQLTGPISSLPFVYAWKKYEINFIVGISINFVDQIKARSQARNFNNLTNSCLYYYDALRGKYVVAINLRGADLRINVNVGSQPRQVGSFTFHWPMICYLSNLYNYLGICLRLFWYIRALSLLHDWASLHTYDVSLKLTNRFLFTTISFTWKNSCYSF